MRFARRKLLGLAAGVVFSSSTLAHAFEEPPKIAGTWIWSWKDAKEETHRHSLELEGTGSKLMGRERADDLDPVKVEALKQEGKTLSFAVNRDGRYSEYKGILDSADTINGRVTVMQGGATSEYGWTATRKPLAK